MIPEFLNNVSPDTILSMVVIPIFSASLYQLYCINKKLLINQMLIERFIETTSLRQESQDARLAEIMGRLVELEKASYELIISQRVLEEKQETLKNAINCPRE